MASARVGEFKRLDILQELSVCEQFDLRNRKGQEYLARQEFAAAEKEFRQAIRTAPTILGRLECRGLLVQAAVKRQESVLIPGPLLILLSTYFKIE